MSNYHLLVGNELVQILALLLLIFFDVVLHAHILHLLELFQVGLIDVQDVFVGTELS